MKATEGALSAGTPDGSAIAQFGLDPDFRANWAGARAAGLVRGAYHFGRPDLGNSPEAEAAWFWSVVGGSIEPGDLIALDLESGSGNLAGWTARFLAALKAHAGFNPLLYASPNFLATRGINFRNVGGDYGLWEADWVATEPAPAAGWPVLAIWQYGSGGTLAGIAGRVDGDVFNGDRATLLKYGKPGLAGAATGNVTPPPPAPIYRALTDGGKEIASGPDEAAIEASAVAWQRADLTHGATITKDGKPYKTLPPLPAPVESPSSPVGEDTLPTPPKNNNNGGKVSIDPQTQKDASALAVFLTSLFGTGPDGIESGFGTSEFWLMVFALVLDVAGPYYHILGSITPTTEAAIAGLIAATYTALRSWRKKKAAAPAAK